MKKPIIVIPIGDIAGVGPEIVVKALAYKEVYDWCIPIVVGELTSLQRVLAITGLTLEINVIEHTKDAIGKFGSIDLVDLKNINAADIEFGVVQAAAGQAAYEFIEKAVRLIEAGEADAIATTAINKEALHAAKVPYIGHTEIIGGLAGVKDPMTMFQVHNLRVFFLSRHLSLADAIDYVTEENVYNYIYRTYAGLKSLGVENPHFVIAGLNPHCGEHGLFGNQEVVSIEPAIKRAQAEGIDVAGPVGADSVFHQALGGRYDAVISLYHDQGHIATKMVDFERTISVTMGMEFLRTSVDHGTAFDIAGKNIVSEVSMYEAIKLAAEYSKVYDSSVY
ncbi:MAG: 4-hydroxythreonine-4-phosphate dehydrogenase PdxA [Clostridiales Family XIII bacterium]|jgi:4-hydroxythreonine-4-phosphate dehydrogenase|nr:4-hydroxythreonine-4-phosphate dehydrogenase PdxA [Clostridiales Family XIII bacterium]